MPTIEVDESTRQAVLFAAQMAGVSESEIIRRLVAASVTAKENPEPEDRGVGIYADYEGHRVRAKYFEPTRVEIVDGPLAGQSFKTPTGAARAVVRHYNPSINDNRNGWTFWQLDNGTGARVWLQSIRPRGIER
jgi:negative regulator of replication initiation